MFSSLILAAAAAAAPSKGGGAGEISLTPEASKLPGSTALQGLINGLYGWAIMILVGALVAYAIYWAVTHHSGNAQHGTQARKGLSAVIIGAIVVGAAVSIVHWALGVGGQVH